MATRMPCGCFTAVLLLALAAIPSVWLDRAGVTTDAVVRGKDEYVRLARDPDGGWRRTTQLDVAFPAPGHGESHARVDASAARYDSLHAGSHVSVRYLPCCPFFARLADRSTTTAVRELATRETTLGPWLAWLAVGIAAMLLAYRLGRAASVIVALGWLATGWILILRPPPPLPPPGPAHATARVFTTSVVNSTLHSRRHGSWHLAMPYLVVQANFLPAGARDSVLAVDAVDSGSVARPADGSLVEVAYDPRAPRGAQLVGGTRTFVARNRGPMYFLVLAPVAFGLLAALAPKRSARNRGPGVAAPPLGDVTPRARGFGRPW